MASEATNALIPEAIDGRHPRHRLIGSILVGYGLLPQLEFALYFLGIRDIAGKCESLFALGTIIWFAFTVLGMRTLRERTLLVLFASCLLVNAAFCVINNGVLSGFYEWLKIVKNFYLVFMLGCVFYREYFEPGLEEELYRLVLLLGFSIACVNILQVADQRFFHSGYYELVKKYTIDTFPTLEPFTAMRRTMGYFFDLHSQYFLPLVAAFMTLAAKRRNWLFYLLAIVDLASVFLSGVRLSYAIILVMIPLCLISVDRSTRRIYLAILAGSIAMTALFFSGFLVHYINQVSWGSGNAFGVILDHLVRVPVQLLREAPATFFLGGDPSRRATLYSEVYFWTMFFYIGLVGIGIYLLPFVLLRRYRRFAASLMAYFVLILSLLHYKVFNTGINIVASALPFAALLAYMREAPERRMVVDEATDAKNGEQAMPLSRANKKFGFFPQIKQGWHQQGSTRNSQS